MLLLHYLFLEWQFFATSFVCLKSKSLSQNGVVCQSVAQRGVQRLTLSAQPGAPGGDKCSDTQSRSF